MTNQVAYQAQVEAEHYDFEHYEETWRWMSYWHQLRVTFSVSPRTVLEIGSGTGAYASRGIQVDTADIDGARSPTYVSSVTELDSRLPPAQTYDLVTACQVLEHISFADFELALTQLAARTRRHVLLTLPHRGFRYSVRVGYNNSVAVLHGRIPKPWPFRFNGEHYWELGWKHSPKSITEVIRKHFKVEKAYSIPENPYHYLWLLRLP